MQGRLSTTGKPGKSLVWDIESELLKRFAQILINDWCGPVVCTVVGKKCCWNPDVHLCLSPCPEAELSSCDAHQEHKAEGMNCPALTEDVFWGFPCGSGAKNPPANAGDTGGMVFSPWVEKIPWRRKWQPTLVFLPGKSHGETNPADYSPWGRKELDMAE